ncbi:hypothetical protein HF086_015602 [Spodoptera exigua]|uniref:Uncharacterized protein n=1 Tax=Spodoptera exigua TaxID=7107 RepID=A0A922M126_SPOEX|nr:hypothetical protein HF086_015602 [Spodoptera exigua]
MVHVDSHTISKSIDNDNKVDDIDSITDVERTRSPKLKRDRLQNNYRLDYKDEFVRPEYVFKETKLYSEAETTTQKTSPKSTTEHPKHHKSPKRREEADTKNKEHVLKHPTTAVYRASKLKNKRKTKNPFTPRPPDGKHVKREVDNTIIESDPTTEPALTFEPAQTAEPTPIAETASIAEPVSITESNSLHKNCKLGVGKTAQYDNIQKSKFKIKTVEPYKMTERVADASEGSENGPLEPLSTQLANLKNKYGLNKGVSNTFSLSPSKHRTESTTPKTTTVEEPEFAGTAQIEELLNDIKVKAIARITQENPMVTDVITNTVNEATFEADPILTHIATTGYDMDTIKDISSQNAERTVSLENENEIDQNDPTLKSNTESHYIVARSIKDDTITMAHNVEDKLEKELKSIYNKVKHKVSCDFNKAKSTIKQGINKISSTCGINITTTKISTKATHKPATKAKAHNTKPAEKTKEKATSRHIRGTPTLKTTVKSDQDFSKTTYDDYVMLTLYEEMLAKTHEENIRKMLSTTDVPLVRKRRHHLRLSKRNPETLGDVKLKEVVEKLYDDSANMPDYDMGDMEPSANANMTTTHPSELPNSDNGSLEPPVVIQEGVMSEPEQHIHNSASTLMPSSAEEDLTDTSLEGLSNKISYNDFVNGYRHYLKFQKEQGHQNFSNLVKYQAHRHHSVDDIGKFILNKIPHVPSVRRKRSFLDESDMDYQEITTKSDDSWFKKHFYLFIDNGPPKKFHTSQTVELKSAATEAPKTYGTDAMIPKPARKDQVYISIGSDEATKDKTTKDSAISLEDLSNALDSIKIKQTVGPYYKDLKTHSKLNTTPRNIVNTEDSIQSFMGRIFGGKRSQAAQQSTWTSTDDWSPVEMFTENPMNRMKRTVNEGSVSIVDDFVNKELEEKPTTATKDFAESSVKTRGTNKYGYVDIDLVPRQTAVVKLRENTKKSRFKNFFKRFHFKKNEKKTKEKPKRSCYNDEENYGFGNRRSRFNPIKKLKDMFRVKPEGRKEEGPAVYNNPPNIPDYDMMTSHIDTFKPVKYDKPMSVDEMQRQIPNISDADALITKPTTAQTSYHFQLDDSDRALLSHYPTSPTVTPSFAEHKEIPSEVPPITPQILGFSSDWRMATVAYSGDSALTAAQKDMPAVTPTLKTTGTTTKPTTTTQATTSIRPTERKAKKAKKANKTTKTQKTTVRQKHPPNNVMTVNVKTMKTAKTTKVTKARKPSTTTTATKRSTTTTSKTTTTTPNLITDFAEIYRAEPDPVHLYKTVPPDLLETDSTDFFNTESTPGMTLDDINLVLHNIQNKLQRITSTEYPKFSTGDFKRGTMYSTKHHDIPIQMPKPPNKVEELTIKTKMTRIAKFPLSKRQFKSTSLDGIPIRDGSFYQGINEEQLKNYPYYLSNRYSPHYLSSRYSPHYLSSRYSSAYLNNRNSVPGIKMSSKNKPFYSSTSKPQSGARRYTDYFNDLVMWHNDILNLDKVPSPVWKDILENVQTDATERYTTPNMSNIIKELKEMNEYLCESDLPTLGESNSSKVMDPYMQMAYTDVQKYPNLNKQGVVRSVVMNDDTIVTSKNLLIKGEAKYYQYNKPSVVVKKIKSSDFMTKLSSPKFNDDEKLSKARDSKKVNKSPFKKHGQLYTPFLKTNKAPMQYFTTPLPMKSDEFNKFLKEHMMDVESVTSPTLELPTFNDNWTTREHKHSTSSLYNIAMKPLKKPPVTKSNPRNIVKIADLKKMNNELMKSINYTSQLLMKTSPAQRPQSNSKANSFEDDFERQKRFSEVSKMPRLASDKSDKVNQEANYYKIIKKKMKERLFEKKGTPAEHPSSGTASFNPRNKEVEITIINFDDIENITTTPAYETYTMPVFKKEETFNMPTYTTELTERTDTTISSTTTEYTPKFEFTAKDEMHNGLLYKDIFNEHDQTTTTSTDFTTLEGKSTTEYVDPSLNEPPSTAMNKIRYPFDKIPQMYPSILDGIPHVKNFNSPPKRVHISSHHYKYDIFYDDNKKIVKSGFDYRDSLFEPAPSMGFGKRSQMKDRYLIPPANMEATQKHRMFTWRGCKPKPEGGLSAPGENPEDKITQKEQQTFQPSTPAFTLNADITLQPEFTTQHESTIMSAVTDGPTQTTELRAKKKEKKEIDIEDLNAGGETIFGGPTGTTEQKMDPKINKRTTTATITTVKYETNAKKSFLDEIEVEKSTTESEKSHNKGLFNKSNEPLSVEPVVYNDQMYYEEGSHYDPLTPPSPSPSTSETNLFGKHYDIKRDLQTQQNTFTAKDVAALEVIVDLMKNTLSYEEKDIASVFQTNNYIALPHATKSIQPSNESTNAIQVHIAIPFDFQANKKRSPLDPVRVRKVFSAKMSTPVDLEYQVHSFEGTVDSTTDQTVATTTSRNANAAFSPHVSIEGALSPGMYLLVDKPKTGLALKPIKGKINFPI